MKSKYISYFFVSLLLIIVFVVFPNKSFAITGTFSKVLNGTQGTTNTCQPAVCKGNIVSGKWQAMVEYSDNIRYVPTAGTQLEYFSQNGCPDGSQTSNPCPANCNSDSECNGGLCYGGNTTASNLCTLGDRGPKPWWCQGASCGFRGCQSSTQACTAQPPGFGSQPLSCPACPATSYTCKPNSAQNYGCSLGSGCPLGYNQENSLSCPSGQTCCYTPPPTCPVGQMIENKAYYCSDSCTDNGVTSSNPGYFCSSGLSCCYIFQLPICKCPAENTISCNTSITPSNQPCDGKCTTGTKCPANQDCTNSGCKPRPTPKPATPVPVPIGECGIKSVDVTGRTATAVISDKVGRNAINWKLDDKFLGANGGPSATATDLTPGYHVFTAQVWCANKVCNFPPVDCSTGPFNIVAGPTPPPAEISCLICDGGKYRSTSKSNCSKNTPTCNRNNQGQGACKGSSSVGAGASCGQGSSDPSPAGAWVTTIAKFRLPDGRDYNGEGMSGQTVPIYLGVTRNDCNWNSTWGDSDYPTYERGSNWALDGIDGDWTNSWETYSKRGWKAFQWELNDEWFMNRAADENKNQQRAMGEYSEFLYPSFPPGFNVTRNANTSARDVCQSNDSNGKSQYCISLNTLLGDLSSKGNHCTGGYYQEVIFTITPPPPGGFHLSQPTSVCSGANPYVDLSWGDSSGATSYDIYKSGSGGSSFTWIGQQDINTKTFRDTNVLRNANYSYKIISSNGYSTNQSNTVSIQTSNCDTTPPEISFPFVYDGSCLDKTNWSTMQNMTAIINDSQSGVGNVKFVITPTPPTQGGAKEYIAAFLTADPVARCGVNDDNIGGCVHIPGGGCTWYACTNSCWPANTPPSTGCGPRTTITSGNGPWGTNIPLLEKGEYNIKVVASDIMGNTASGTNYPFETEDVCIGPWIQVNQGDVHSNTYINLPQGPPL